MKELFINNTGKVLIEDKNYHAVNTPSIPAIITGYTFIKDRWGSLSMINFIDGDIIDFSLPDKIKNVCEQEMDFFKSRLKSGTLNYIKVFVTENGFDERTEDAILKMSNRSVFKGYQLIPVILDLSCSRAVLDDKYRKSNAEFILLLNNMLSKKDSMTEFYNLSAIEACESQKSGLSDLGRDEKYKGPYVTYILIAINVIMFAVMTAAGGTENTDVLIKFGAKVNTLIVEGQYWRLIASAFIHIGLAHIAFNMYGLYTIGTLIEKLYGHANYLLIYLVSAISGSINSFIFSQSLSAGASGAIFGLLGALLYLGKKKPRVFSTSFGASVLVVIAFNLIYGFSNTGIDNFAHLGGLIGGYLVANALGLINEKKKVGKKALWLIVIFVLLISGLFIGIKKNMSSYEYNYSMGVNYYSSKKYTVSETYLKRAESSKPDSAEVKAILSLVYYNEGKYPQGEQEYTKAVSLDKNQPYLYFSLGNYFFDHKQYGNSEQMFRKYISVKSGTYEGYLNLGTALDMEGKYNEAESNLRKAVEMKPDDLLANSNLGYLYFDEQKFTEAKKYLTKASQLDPKNKDVQEALKSIESKGY